MPISVILQDPITSLPQGVSSGTRHLTGLRGLAGFVTSADVTVLYYSRGIFGGNAHATTMPFDAACSLVSSQEAGMRGLAMISVRHNPIRILARSPSAFAVCVCSILYLFWYLPTANVKHELKSAWSDAPRRLIVFGDSWSDNGRYPIEVPPKTLVPVKEEAQGLVWTEWLCLAIKCNHHDNFARSLPSAPTTDLKGAVIDGAVLNRTLGADHGETTALSDLKTQVRQWLRFEKKQYMTSRTREKERRGTVFTVWFSLWDIWYYSQLDGEAASKAVTQSMDTLFAQLEIIADNWPPGAKIILPEAMDPTFLPGWSMKRTGPAGSDHRADDQRNAIELVNQWNMELDQRASDWHKGQIYIYNTNDWMLDQVREAQLVVGDMADHNGLGHSGTPWDSVHSACVVVAASDYVSPAKKHKTLGSPRCSYPDKFLFWDDMHLGPAAHQMIGQGIAQDIAESHRDSWFAHEQAEESKDLHPAAEAAKKPSVS
ncbi:MAG: hypothetical protein LQ350_002000 [Teloschistes chrysophthalmus]|nr:MAG: hypothetical protein LQ350_002000 [Niorma chrysophthalma]